MADNSRTSAGACLQLDPAAQPATPWSRPRLVQAPEVAAPARRVNPPAELGYYIVPGTGGHGRARADGLLAVTRVFPCRVAVYGYDRTRRDKFLIMIAVRPVLDALEILLPQIALQMEATARTAATAYGEHVRSAHPQMPADMRRRTLKIPYFRNYLRGYGTGVAGTVHSLRAEAIQAAGPVLGQLLGEEDALAETAYNRGFPGARPLRPERAGHPGGYDEGLDAGLAADLGDEYAVQHDLVFAML
jgi:hypothetical protein